MKYCKDCKHYKNDWQLGGVYWCKNPKLGKDIVTGWKNIEHASIIRRSSDQCGLSAKWFEQKQPWWKFWQ